MRLTSPSETGEGEERAAGFVLFRTLHSQRQYLLLHHQGASHWGFPKGRLEPGEDDMKAALRETREETNIKDLSPISGFRRTSTYTVQRGGQCRSKTVAYFLAETTQSNVVLSSEHQGFRWLPFADAMALLTYDESRRILADAEQSLAASPK